MDTTAHPVTEAHGKSHHLEVDHVWARYLPLFGRIFLAQIFLMAGFTKIMDMGTTQAYMAHYGMPYTLLFAIGAIFFELGGGLSILLGFKARWGALALALFLVPTTLIFHTAFGDQTQMIMFMKNVAIIGGLLTIASYGPGKLSLDHKLGTK